LLFFPSSQLDGDIRATGSPPGPNSVLPVWGHRPKQNATRFKKSFNYFFKKVNKKNVVKKKQVRAQGKKQSRFVLINFSMGTAQAKEAPADSWSMHGFNVCEPCPTQSPNQTTKNGVKGKALPMKGHGEAYKILFENTPSSKRNSKSSIGEGSNPINDERTILDAAVLSVAQRKFIHPPGAKHLNSIQIRDGRFSSDKDHEFWLLVSQQIPESSASECFLKYKEYHRSDVARFFAKSSSKWRSTSDIETSISAGDPLTPKSKPTSPHRRHSQNM
jgi:hypothetical protein